MSTYILLLAEAEANVNFWDRSSTAKPLWRRVGQLCNGKSVEYSRVRSLSRMCLANMKTSDLDRK